MTVNAYFHLTKKNLQCKTKDVLIMLQLRKLGWKHIISELGKLL